MEPVETLSLVQREGIKWAGAAAPGVADLSVKVPQDIGTRHVGDCTRQARVQASDPMSEVLCNPSSKEAVGNA